MSVTQKNYLYKAKRIEIRSQIDKDVKSSIYFNEVVDQDVHSNNLSSNIIDDIVGGAISSIINVVSNNVINQIDDFILNEMVNVLIYEEINRTDLQIIDKIGEHRCAQMFKSIGKPITKENEE